MFGSDWRGEIYSYSMLCEKNSPIEFTVNGRKIPVKFSGKVITLGEKINEYFNKIEEIQIEREPVKEAKKGDHIGIKVPEKVRPNDKVFLVK